MLLLRKLQPRRARRAADDSNSHSANRGPELSSLPPSLIAILGPPTPPRTPERPPRPRVPAPLTTPQFAGRPNLSKNARCLSFAVLTRRSKEITST